MNSVLSEQIAEILNPTLDAEGYELVEINLSQMGNGIVQLVAERLYTKNIIFHRTVKCFYLNNIAKAKQS